MTLVALSIGVTSDETLEHVPTRLPTA